MFNIFTFFLNLSILVYNGTIEGINIAVKKQPLNEFQNTNIMITSTDGIVIKQDFGKNSKSYFISYNAKI